MSATSKRRRTYYLSLPVVVTVVFLLVAKLVAMQRAEIIAELSHRVAHRDAEDASAAVRQLGEMPHPPAAVLVAAATTADRRVASEAQQAIIRVLRRAQRQLEAGRGEWSVARQLSELAREPLVLLDLPSTREYFLSRFLALGIEPIVAHRTPSYEMVRCLVANGHGYSMLNMRPAEDLTYDGKRLVCRPLKDPLVPARVVLVRLAGATLTRRAQAFAECTSASAARGESPATYSGERRVCSTIACT